MAPSRRGALAAVVTGPDRQRLDRAGIGPYTSRIQSRERAMAQGVAALKVAAGLAGAAARAGALAR